MNKIKIGFQRLLNKIYPQPLVVGLEARETFIRLAELKRDGPKVSSYRLPPGVVENGQVKDKVKLTAALGEIARSTGSGPKKGIVLTVSSKHIFIQTVNLPPIAARNLEEAALLNVQMASPLRQGEFYYDWQRVNKDKADGGPIELLGAFVSRELVDGFSYCIREAGMSLVAVEFASLSLVRLLNRRKVIVPQRPYLLAEIAPEGTTFMLVNNNELLFHSFHDLGGGQGEEVKVADFLATLKNEASNISNFYLSHWGGVINDLIFISSSLEQEIREVFKDKAVVFLKPEEIVPAAGAAYRRLLGDKEINILGTSSLEVFQKSRALTFVSLWRTILIATLGFLLIVSVASDLFLRGLARRTTEVSAFTLNEPGHRELLKLKDDAARFNGLVLVAGQAREGTPEIGRIADLITNVAGTEIRINRLYLPSLSDPVTVSGSALSEQAAIAFKNRLALETNFTQVELPISGIAPEVGGRVSFTIYLHLNLEE